MPSKEFELFWKFLSILKTLNGELLNNHFAVNGIVVKNNKRVHLNTQKSAQNLLQAYF